MKKQQGRKLTLSKETLRTLTEHEMDGIQGGSRVCTSQTSNTSLTCDDTCIACGSAAGNC